jgi:hypothetical protein
LQLRFGAYGWPFAQTFKGVDLYLRDHLAATKPLAFLIIAFGVIVPWCVGAYRAARAANKTLRAIGSMEVLLFLLAAAVPLVARG